jgi:protein involved in ribonucleotide reduction
MNLADALGLRPLDRVQVNDKKEIREMRWDVQMGRANPDLPYWYFQRTMQDGRVEVRAPGGYATFIDPQDICDIVHGEPLEVRAMPKQEFLRRLRLPLAERNAAPRPESYAKAHVLYVSKDRWGRVDETFVWFDDPALNEDRVWNAPVHPEDKPLVQAKARRTCMPVVGKGSANYSADHGVAAQQDTARYISLGFMRLSLRGEKAAAASLREAGLTRMTRADLHKKIGRSFIHFHDLFL